ncbi:FAD-dependent thymidylate synthase [Candidatus Curtissbacteria bacterium]|nr:FAD-dependent thymidylate synthase [Candidatus Curtissbacteria bacterium]
MKNFPVERFTREEAWFIEPFFTNLDKNVFAAKYLPSEVLGALASRYSRSVKGVRRLFYDEYIKPIIEPDLPSFASTFAKASVDKKASEGKEGARDRREAEVMKKELIGFVEYLHTHGGWEAVVNSRRARDFFSKWLAAYGDDSIAQMAGAHIFFENVSNIATKFLEDFRIGFAPLEKSTRYVLFDEKVGGKWRYYVDPDLARSSYGLEYKKTMDMLFRRYAQSIEPLSKYLRKIFPQEKDQSDRAYRETIKAKTCDVLRAYLPAATLTNVGFFGVGQALEYVLTKSFASPIAEIRQLAREAQIELNKVIPSLVDRASSPRGKIYQRYVRNTERDLEVLAKKYISSRHSGDPAKPETSESKSEDSGQALRLHSGQLKGSELYRTARMTESGIELVEWDTDAEDKIIASLLYRYSNSTYYDVKDQVSKLTPKQKLAIIKKAVARRGVRQHRLVRAFENTYYKFDIIANFGAYRDLHRHRMLTQERQRFTTELGFDVPHDLLMAKMAKPYIDAVKKVDRLYRRVKKRYPDQAQYLVMMGNRIRWYQWENLRELGWEAELRTGPQGHPDYRLIEHQKVEAVRAVHPSLVQALKFVDFNKYDLARRESEKRIDRKLEAVRRNT